MTSNTILDAEVIRLDLQREQSNKIDGARLLFEVSEFLGRFIAYPNQDAQIAHTLWIAHTHIMESWETTPRLAFLSPEPQSGKTRALEVSELLVPNAVETVNMSSAYLFRRIGAEVGMPTLLMDEVDALFNGKSQAAEEIRGLLNAGYRRGAMVGRCVIVGKIVETVESPSFCAVALAGLGWLPDTLMGRSVIIRMRRRGPQEKVEPFRRREQLTTGEVLQDRLAAWAAPLIDEMKRARPEMPTGIEDRAADCWEASALASGRPRQGDTPRRLGGPGRGRGLVMFTKPLPRFVIAKRLTCGATCFYFNIPTLYRKLGCAVSNEPLGTDYILRVAKTAKAGGPPR